MIPRTIGFKYDVGRIVPVQCVKNEPLKDINIKGHAFLMIIIYEGIACFQVGGRSFEAFGPCLVCFDERENPKLIRKRSLKCDAIYFHPVFLNVNMTFKLVHSENYNRLAIAHDLFLLKPFTDQYRFIFPIFKDYLDGIRTSFNNMENELREQRDWYWSCRSRSYFIEIILILERIYGVFEQGVFETISNEIINPHLKNAIIFIEGNYQECSLTLENIRNAASINHSTLSKLFKEELNMTPMEYLWHHRIVVAKKHLEFTTLQIGEISELCGFKSIQHFVKRFKDTTGVTPLAFRESAVAERKTFFKDLK
jgi:AraC family L-rhamnose operon regulatory protein RhaS